MKSLRAALSFAAFALLVACAGPAPRADELPAERDAVLAVVNDFFAAMHARDPQAAARTVLPAGVFVSSRVIDGARVERHFTNQEWIDRLRQEKTTLLEEFTGTPEVRIAGDVAQVWCAYRFTIDGQLSHTGVDAFDLVRTAVGWRISGGAYSVVKPGDAAAR